MEALSFIVSVAGIVILVSMFWWFYLPRIFVVNDPYADVVADFRSEISRWEHDS